MSAAEEYARDIRASVPPVSEDTVISMLTNCMAARVSKRFGLRGPTMNVDQGLDSTLVAVRLAIRALRTGGTDVVLVSGLSCFPGPEVTALLDRLNPGLPTVAEGAFTLALTTERTATTRQLDVLARLHPHRSEDPRASSILRSGPGPDRTYLGADGAVALLSAATTPGDDVLVLPHCGPFGASTPDGLLVRTC